jgi:hypothetical protein
MSVHDLIYLRFLKNYTPTKYRLFYQLVVGLVARMAYLPPIGFSPGPGQPGAARWDLTPVGADLEVSRDLDAAGRSRSSPPPVSSRSTPA